jgi:hypothetical protein
MKPDAQTEALLLRLQRVEDDLERLHALDQAGDVALAIAALQVEAQDLRRLIDKP